MLGTLCPLLTTTHSRPLLNAGVRGIPHAFVVDGEGKLRYSGHPAQPDFVAAVDKWLGMLKPATVRPAHLLGAKKISNKAHTKSR